jgi:hypothetical protein
MSKTRNRRPASDTRPARRSLLELSETVGRAVVDGLATTPAGPIDTAADDPLRSEHAATTGRTEVPERAAVPVPAARAEAPNAQVPRVSEGAASESAAEMVVKIAKDYQNGVLDNIRASLNAALDHAKDYAETKRTGEASGDAGTENDGLRVFGAAAAAFRAEALELMQANFAATLDYARELAGARTTAEVVELSGTQARKSCELMIKQADALKSLAGAIARERDGHGCG